VKTSQNRVSNGCRELMQQIGCNRRPANRINTFSNVPLATMHGSHSPRTTRARFWVLYQTPARVAVSTTTTYGGYGSRYYPAGCVREGCGNSHEGRKTFFPVGFRVAEGVGLVARLAVGGIEYLAALAAGRITTASRWAPTCASSTSTGTYGFRIA
jgi:hypothetical protein